MADTSTTLAPADQSRAEFEHWASNEGTYLNAVQRSGEGYLLAITQSYWSAWQAARRAPAPASSEPVAAPAGMEPVAHLIVRSAFRASPDGQDAEGNEWLEEAQSPDEPGAFAVFTAAQVQSMLAAAPSGLVDKSSNLQAQVVDKSPKVQGSGPARVPQYRLLVRGRDTIQADDEFLCEDGVTWRKDPSGIFVGITYEGNILLPARRAVKSDRGITAAQKGVGA